MQKALLSRTATIRFVAADRKLTIGGSILDRRQQPTLQSSPIWRRRQALFDLINRDTLGILGDDILYRLVCMHQRGVDHVAPVAKFKLRHLYLKKCRDTLIATFW